MKRTITLLIATALILGMSQCKKNVETITPSDLGEAVHITVNVDDGGKHIVYPGTGAYVFEDGDKLYVGHGGKYVGYLEYKSDAFSGTIYPTSTEDYLHFYFVGGLAPSTTLEWGETEDFTVNISDQRSKLPVLSYNRSTEKYVDGNTTYYCTLENKCGLVKFKPLVATSKAIKVGGMKTEAKIDFATPGITSTETTGNVILYSESDEAKWAILLPQGQVNNPQVAINTFSSSITSVPPVINNLYYTTGVDITMDADGKLNGEFTVNSSGGKVHFSQGNLQYNKGTGKFSFMEHQYSTVETTGQNVGDNYASQNIVSLFGWGTSGYNNKYPYMTSTNSSDYGDGSSSISGTNYDWGVYNRNNIEGGGDHNDWRTLTKAEWVYVFQERTDASEKYGHGSVNGVNGMIILPDDWVLPSGLTFTAGKSEWANSYTTAQWEEMEVNGAVFLPAAGLRHGTSVNDVGINGSYWSSTYSLSGYADNVYFYSDYVNLSSNDNYYYGNSVRLVF